MAKNCHMNIVQAIVQINNFKVLPSECLVDGHVIDVKSNEDGVAID